MRIFTLWSFQQIDSILLNRRRKVVNIRGYRVKCVKFLIFTFTDINRFTVMQNEIQTYIIQSKLIVVVLSNLLQLKITFRFAQTVIGDFVYDILADSGEWHAQKTLTGQNEDGDDWRFVVFVAQLPQKVAAFLVHGDNFTRRTRCHMNEFILFENFWCHRVRIVVKKCDVPRFCICFGRIVHQNGVLCSLMNFF